MSPHSVASSSNVGSAMSTCFKASANTVRVRATSPFQPRGRKSPSNATVTPCLRELKRGEEAAESGVE